MKKISIIKIVLTILLLIFLFYKIDLISIIDIFQSLDLFFVTCGLVMVPLLYILRTWRWNFFLSAMGVSLPFLKLLRIILIGNFYGLITPGKLGELGRAFHLDEKKTITLPTIIMEKLLDIGILLLLSFITIMFFFKDSFFMKISILIISIGVFGVIYLFLNKNVISYLGKMVGIAQEDIGESIRNFIILLKNYKVILKTVIVTLVYYLIAYFIAYFIAISAHMKGIVFFMMPIIVLMGNIPITISGLGIRESIGSFTFLLMGESAANGFVFSFLLFILITFLPAILGYIFTMGEK